MTMNFSYRVLKYSKQVFIAWVCWLGWEFVNCTILLAQSKQSLS